MSFSPSDLHQISGAIPFSSTHCHTQWHPTPVLLPGKSYGGAWWAAVHGVAKSRIRLSDFTFTFHFSLSCIGDRNGNPLQGSCLADPRDRGAWWAAVYEVAQSRTRLKWLSSSSSNISTGNYTQSPKINHNRKGYIKECTYVYNLVTLLYSRDRHNILNQLYFI